MGEDIRGELNENQVQISKNIAETLEEDIKQEEDKITLEKNLISRSIQEEIMEFPIADKLKVDNLQSLNEKSNEELVMAGFKGDVVQISAIKYQGKSFVMLGGVEMRWRPKTRAKNKLRLSMKKLLNPKLAKEKIIVIEDSSYREDLEEDEDLNSQ